MYLVGTKNFSKDQVSQEIYPIGTYSTLLLLLVIFLITDLARYKPVIIVQSLAGVVCYSLITFCASLEYVQAAEVFYGLFLASEVAYSTYMYASTEKEFYQKVTSYTRIALQSGRLVSGVVGQVLISCELLNFHELNFLSLAGLSLSAVFGCLLPSAHRSLYFRCEQNEVSSITSADFPPGCNNDTNPGPSADTNLLQDVDKSVSGDAVQCKLDSGSKSNEILRSEQHLSGFKKIQRDFLFAFSNVYIIKWSLWWSLTHCGYLQVTSYVQNLWQDTIDLNGGQLYNGFASATYTLLGIAASWVAGRLKFDFDGSKCQWLLSTCAFLSGALVIFSTMSQTLYYQYVAYGAFKILYQIMMIVANTEVAKSLARDSHGLIFGFNTFAALILQTILTVTVTGKGGLQLSIRHQFFVYGGYFVVMGCGFGISELSKIISLRLSHQNSKKGPP